MFSHAVPPGAQTRCDSVFAGVLWRSLTEDEENIAYVYVQFVGQR